MNVPGLNKNWNEN